MHKRTVHETGNLQTERGMKLRGACGRSAFKVKMWKLFNLYNDWSHSGGSWMEGGW